MIGDHLEFLVNIYVGFKNGQENMAFHEEKMEKSKTNIKDTIR